VEHLEDSGELLTDLRQTVFQVQALSFMVKVLMIMDLHLDMDTDMDMEATDTDMLLLAVHHLHLLAQVHQVLVLVEEVVEDEVLLE
jgi:hypothetical protein